MSLSRTILFLNAILLLFLGIEKMLTLNQVLNGVDYFALQSLAGAMLMFGGLLSLIPLEFLKFTRVKWLFLLPISALLFFNILKLDEVGYIPEQLIEHSLQLFLPIAVIWRLSEGVNKTHLINGLNIALALTFVGHGLLAIGWHGVPSHFISMTTTITGLNEYQAVGVLNIIGILDIAMAIGIFIPRFRRSAKLYMIVWGFLTAAARPVSVGLGDGSIEAVLSSLPAFLHRLPHFVLPFYLLTEQKVAFFSSIWRNFRLNQRFH
jgi:hypothetical protein